MTGIIRSRGSTKSWRPLPGDAKAARQSAIQSLRTRLQDVNSILGFNRSVKPLLMVIALGSMCATARADSWDEAIAIVERSAQDYFDYAVEVGGTGFAGSMYNGYMFSEHRCAVLGRMLGELDAIRHLEEFEYPPMDARSEPHDLLVFSISLGNWVSAARWAVDASRDERITRWNLDCVGQFDIPRTVALQSLNPQAEFNVDDQHLLVYGDIDVGFAGRFIDVLEENPQITTVALGSGGGSVRDAILAGLAIRDRGLDTTIFGNCFSACPLVFMGGWERVLWASPYRLGFHQVYVGDGHAISFDSETYNLISSYVFEMGGNGDSLVTWMHASAPANMFHPEAEELCAANVATFIQRICGF